MRKFLVLIKKEIKELITIRLVLPLLIMTFVFGMVGNMINQQVGEVNAPMNIAVVDEDESRVSKDLIDQINKSNYVTIALEEGDYIAQTKDKGLRSLMVIPPNFGDELKALERPRIKFFTFADNFSLSSTMKGSKVTALKGVINESLSNYLIAERIRDVNPQQLKTPVEPVDFVVVKQNSAQISFEQLTGFIQSQTTFVPIILFLVIVLASQMVATTIATEKENKTLEILISSPVNRKMIVFAKILASGLVALLFCLVYMIGFKSYMSGVMGGAGVELMGGDLTGALQQLGVVIDVTGYLLLGASLFLSILCALAIAIILGILAEDVKGVQTVITPLMILILVPYFITMFADVKAFAPAIQYLIYAIPFSHPFLAMKNVIMQEYSFVIFGIIYQAIVFGLFVVIAARIFSSDKILTFKFSLKKDKK